MIFMLQLFVVWGYNFSGDENYLWVSFNLQAKDILHTTIMPPKGRKCFNNFISVSTMRERDWKGNKTQNIREDVKVSTSVIRLTLNWVTKIVGTPLLTMWSTTLYSTTWNLVIRLYLVTWKPSPPTSPPPSPQTMEHFVNIRRHWKGAGREVTLKVVECTQTFATQRSL